MTRILILGTSGSGKTTLARNLSSRLNIPHIELDALYWGPDWTPVAPDLFRQRVQQAASADSWIACGNYNVIRDLLWPRVDTFIWLDYSFPLTFFRVFRRTARRCWTRETLWSGNHEHLRLQLFSKESIFWWVITTWSKRRQELPPLLKAQSVLGKTILQFRRPAQTASWLKSISLQPSLVA